MGTLLAAATEAPAAAAPKATTNPTTAPAVEVGSTGRTYVPWPHRRGRAYPDDFWTSWGRDGKETPAILWDDTKATFTNPVSLAGIALAGASGIVLAGTGVDNSVAADTRNHRVLNSFWDSVGDAGGNPGTHFALAGAMVHGVPGRP